MPTFTAYKIGSGEVVRWGTMPTDEQCLAQANAGEAIYLGEVPRGHFIYGEFMVPIPDQPSPAHLFNWGNHAWYDPRSLDELRTQIKAAVTDKRWQVETGGVALANGIRVKSAKDDQDRVTAVLVNMQVAGMDSIDFKADTGWVTLTYQELGGIAQAIAQHVQSCFSLERLHHEAVDELTSREELLAYDFSVGWGS